MLGPSFWPRHKSIQFVLCRNLIFKDGKNPRGCIKISHFGCTSHYGKQATLSIYQGNVWFEKTKSAKQIKVVTYCYQSVSNIELDVDKSSYIYIVYKTCKLVLSVVFSIFSIRSIVSRVILKWGRENPPAFFSGLLNYYCVNLENMTPSRSDNFTSFSEIRLFI